jgi:hypothetical protein
MYLIRVRTEIEPENNSCQSWEREEDKSMKTCEQEDKGRIILNSIFRFPVFQQQQISIGLPSFNISSRSNGNLLELSINVILALFKEKE